ncbi:MAG: TonB-dependent receptor [Steroidobacteraceae bacterium]
MRQLSRVRMTSACAALIAGASLLGAALPALSQTEGGLQEVTVTATRRGNTNIQETPVAVTAVDAAAIETIVPRDVSDVAAIVPNFSAARITAFNAASFAMRGAGQTDIIVYLEPPVAVIVDDFVMPSVQTQLLDTFDMESVEVLRGPQGTLFGKNTTGGVVVVRTKKPDLFEGGGEIVFGAGSFDRRQAQGAFNLPLVEGKFALRVVGSYVQTDGYYRNGASYGPTVAALPEFVGFSGQANGQRAGGQDVTNGRIKALWQVTDNFSALLQLEALRDRSGAVPSVNDTPAEPGCIPFGDPTAGGCNFVWNSLGFTRDPGDPLDVAATSNRNDAGLLMGRGQRINVDGAYLSLDWNLANNWTVNSVTGYREQKSRLPNTYTGDVPVLPNVLGGGTEVYSLFDAARNDDRETFQQELRLTRSTESSSWVFGGFYQTDKTTFCVLQVLGFLDMLGLGDAFFGDPNFFNNNPQVLCNQQKSDVFAGFADATFNITDRFTLAAGARWTNEEKRWTGRNQVFYQALGGGFDPALNVNTVGAELAAADFTRFSTGVVSDKKSWSEPTWRLTGSYKFTDDVFGYLTLSRGFKSGGYNDQTGTSGNAIDTTGPLAFGRYDPEFANSIDLGLKTELLNNRLRLNTALFYVKYSDSQRALVATVQNSLGQTFQETRFFNAADVEVKGVELEATALLTDRFQIGLSAGYQDGKYKKFQADTNGDGTVDVDFTGQPLTRTPEFSGSLSATYEHPVGNRAKMRWSALFYHEDENPFILSDLGSAFNGNLDAKDLLSANVTLSGADDNWWLRLYGKNLTDERYRVAVQPVANLWTHAQFGEPRSFGVEFGLKFHGGEAPRAVAPPPPPPPAPVDSDGDGVTDDMDKCPGTPAGARVDASGCELDSDGDGVVDSQDQCPGTPAGAKVDARGCEVDSDGDGVVDSKDKCPDTPKGDRVDEDGCSFKEEIRLPGVVFETNSAELSAGSESVLDRAVATLKRYPELEVEVAGHTDSVGSAGYNKTLSQRRAETVMGYLKAHGVSNSLSARGYGEAQPIASNATDEGRQTNRRVVLRIVGE